MSLETSKLLAETRTNNALADETRREALGRFLRERREALSPERAGIASHRGRRTPGLRREEVAFLADIGVKWYSRLEAGDEINPSMATLAGIALALQLDSSELEYMLDLAGLRQPVIPPAVTSTKMPEPFEAFIGTVRGMAVTVGDRILTPMRWNATADALYGHSRYEDPVERNALVRSLVDPDFIAFLGDERERLVFKAVGMFRLNYSSPAPSPLTPRVYDRVKDIPLFRAAWARRIVAGELTNEDVTVRHHPALGSLALYAIDFATPMRPDLFLRTLVPADETTAVKFKQLERMGSGRHLFAGSA